jgi:hypothetical protein
VKLKALIGLLLLATGAGLLLTGWGSERSSNNVLSAEDDSAELGQAGGSRATGSPVPVLVELFTSEGCSSCPPADELLSRLDRTQPVPGAMVIALSEHVDYWNRLGWTDPFSSPTFSRRQSEYADSKGSSDVYTPQMIVDGQTQFVGSNTSRAHQAIAEAARNPKALVSLKVNATATGSLEVAVEVSGSPISENEEADVVLAIVESDLRSNVSRGENAGRRLAHTAVVRSLHEIGTVQPEHPVFRTGRRIESYWQQRARNVRAVVFVQERKSRRIVGAGQVRLGS